MENREFPIGNGNETIKISDFGKEMFLDFLVFILSTAMAYTSDSEFFKPLGITFCGGISRKHTLFACLGAMLGYILSCDTTTGFRYVMTLLLLYILKVYINSFPKLKEKTLPYSAISFFATSSTGIILMITTAFNLDTLFLILSEMATAFGGTYCFTIGFRSFEKLKNNKYLSNREMIFSVISLLIVIMSFGKISLFGVTLSGILSSYVVMCSSYVFKEKGGSLIGTGASLAFIMTGRAESFVFSYSGAGLFSGIFSYGGRILCAMAYIFSYGGIYMFFGGKSENLISPLIETALASVFFVLTPQSIFIKAKSLLLIKAENESIMLKMVNSKRQMTIEGIEGLNRTLEIVSDKMKKTSPPQKAGIYLRVRDSVCSDCASYKKCWQSELFKTIGEFDSLIDEMRRSEKITPSMTPMSLQSRCIRIMSLCDNFNKNYASYCASLGTEGKVNEMRKITTDQFVTITRLFDDMMVDFERGIRPLSDKSAEYQTALEELSINCDVICYEDENMNRLINVTVSTPFNTDVKDIKELLQRVENINLENPTIIEGKESTVMMFWEKPYYMVECDYFQISGKENDTCGDCFDSFYDGRGNFVAVLSDGMGTGSRAAIDGNMTAGLFSKLIIWGFSFPCALRLVNSAMLLKSSDESMATLDILKINLYTGDSIIYKAGATVSLMKRQGKVSVIKKSAMPVGILRQTEFATVKGKLHSGDEIVIMSDGATDNGVDSLKAVMKEQNYKMDSAEKLCTKARNNCVGRCDDITVGVVRLARNNV